MRKGQKDIQLPSYNELLGLDDFVNHGTNQIVEVSLSELYPFKDHPFQVRDDEKMEETVESIRNYGVLNPGLVRPRTEGGYEIVAGHRRKRGCELAGKATMPVLVHDYTDDEADVIMVDSNIQRENILPSEKAFAYRMKLEAMKHQGAKGNGDTADLVGKEARDSGRKNIKREGGKAKWQSIMWSLIISMITNQSSLLFIGFRRCCLLMITFATCPVMQRCFMV
ncbi:MAG: ParB/RepB/Spo0J family partition protein [Clostridiales bacterium]|nr:ParB/RepB/Spo0J family partition protein [Clostridiales bacterium]